MTVTTFRGLYPPLLTPFDEQGRVDERALRGHVDFAIGNGIDGFCAGSSTGELMNLTREEWEGVLQICKEQNAGRVPMIAGGADMSTPATIERCRFAESLGYDGLLIISPWYQVHTMREVYTHAEPGNRVAMVDAARSWRSGELRWDSEASQGRS